MNLDALGIRIGELNRGKLNTICDVTGIRVGHLTIDEVGVHTGITSLLVSDKNPYLAPLNASVYVLNGFGKSTGLMQMDELGELESHIILTNTLSVGRALDGLVRWNMEDLKNSGINLKTFNGIVCECNDSKHNDISKPSISADDVKRAIEMADISFEQGSVGAGRGMTCHGLKGGIGSSSRVFALGENSYTMGTLVLSNYGAMRDFRIGQNQVGREIEKKVKKNSSEGLDLQSELDKGSIILIMATDMPLSSRQIKRVLKRGSVGLARVGSQFGNGSGDVFLGFSTTNPRERTKYCASGNPEDIPDLKCDFINDAKLDIAFRAFAECCEEAILNSMLYAKPIIMTEAERKMYPDVEYAKALSEFILEIIA